MLKMSRVLAVFVHLLLLVVITSYRFDYHNSPSANSFEFVQETVYYGKYLDLVFVPFHASLLDGITNEYEHIHTMDKDCKADVQFDIQCSSILAYRGVYCHYGNDMNDFMIILHCLSKARNGTLTQIVKYSIFHNIFIRRHCNLTRI